MNDRCQNAISLTLGASKVTGTTVNAKLDANYVNGVCTLQNKNKNGPFGVWYYFAGAQTGYASSIVMNFGAATAGVYIFEGSACSSLTCLASFQATGSFSYPIWLSCGSSKVTYYILIEGATGTLSTFDIQVITW